jgi:hypothetical protein
MWGNLALSSGFSPRSNYSSPRDRGSEHRGSGASPNYNRRSGPLQLALTAILLASLLLLAMAAITRYTVAKPMLPQWLSGALHRSEPALPPGMTYDFQIINPETKHQLSEIPEVGAVEMRLAVTNDSALPMIVHFSKGEQTEFIVRRVFSYVGGLFALPIEVWRSSYFHRTATTPSKLTLQPGDTKVYSASFDLTALNSRQTPPGDYLVIAVFNGWETSIPMVKPQ